MAAHFLPGPGAAGVGPLSAVKPVVTRGTDAPVAPRGVVAAGPVLTAEVGDGGELGTLVHILLTGLALPVGRTLTEEAAVSVDAAPSVPAGPLIPALVPAQPLLQPVQPGLEAAEDPAQSEIFIAWKYFL